MTRADLAALKQVAEKATPGPWRARFDGHGGMTLESIDWQVGYLSRAGGKQESNAEFVAAFNPARVLALIAVAEKAKEAEAHLRQLGMGRLADALRSALEDLR